MPNDGMACLFLYCLYELKLWPHFSSLIFSMLLVFLVHFLTINIRRCIIKGGVFFFVFLVFLLQGRIHFLIYLFIFME